jgi:hypothetical protein
VREAKQLSHVFSEAVGENVHCKPPPPHRTKNETHTPMKEHIIPPSKCVIAQNICFHETCFILWLYTYITILI